MITSTQGIQIAKVDSEDKAKLSIIGRLDQAKSHNELWRAVVFFGGDFFLFFPFLLFSKVVPLSLSFSFCEL